MVGLKKVQAALNAPGLVTTSPLSFNQLKIELAKKLHIQADDEVFSEHKQAIKDSYVKVFDEVCKPRAAAPAPAKKTAPPPKKAPAPAKKPAAKKRHVYTQVLQDSESEEEEETQSDGSESASESEESDRGGRKGSAFSSDPEVRRLTGTAKSGWGAVKRDRHQLVEEEEEEEEEEGPGDEPASMQLTALPEPLMLLAVVKSFLDTLVCAQLCNPQGAALFPFVRLPTRLLHSFAGARVYRMSLMHEERLRAVGCGLKGKLVRLLSLGVICTTTSTATTATTTTSTRLTMTVSTTTAHHTSHAEPQTNWGACHKFMQSTVRHVAAGLAAVVRDKVAQEAAELFLEKGQYSAARVQLQRAIHLGDLPSRALEAWLTIGGCLLSEEWYEDEMSEDDEEQQAGFALAEEGARVGCHHCQGMMAVCYCWGAGCKVDAARSLELARESSGKGSRYGQFTLGKLHQEGEGGLVKDYAQAAAFYRLAAAQGLDAAQCYLGQMYQDGQGVAQSFSKALRWFKLAAAQGHSHAMRNVAACYDDASRHWYERAQAAGDPEAEEVLERLERLESWP